MDRLRQGQCSSSRTAAVRAARRTAQVQIEKALSLGYDVLVVRLWNSTMPDLTAATGTIRKATIPPPWAACLHQDYEATLASTTRWRPHLALAAQAGALRCGTPSSATARCPVKTLRRTYMVELHKTVIAAAALALVARRPPALDKALPAAYTPRQLLQPPRPGFATTVRWPTTTRRRAQRGAVVYRELLSAPMPPTDLPPGTGWTYSNIGYLFVRR